MFKVALLCVVAVVVLAESPLPTNLNVSNETITVSGISSGGAMAIQVHVAFSSLIKGVGAVASPPYYCAQGGLSGAMMCMFSPIVVNVDSLVSKARTYASSNLIDSLDNLEKSKVYVFSGTKDTVVAPGSVQKSVSFYQKFVQSENIKSVLDVPAQHAWITDNNRDNQCGYLGNPYVNNCDIDQAGDILQYTLFDQLKQTPKPRTSAKKENLFRYDQTQYGSVSDGLYAWGNVYIPTACQVHKNAGGEACHLHIAFHGCEQNYDYVQERFTAGSGLNEWAEANNIIVLYPQASKISLMTNPNACWDWWGYGSADYANKNGVQMKAVRAMISTLLGGK